MSTAFQSATELSRRIREKEISSRELTDYFIRRIEKHDEGLNAVVVRDFERAREAADAADAALARGDVLGPLHGLPMTIKEAYDLAGTPTTWGDPRFENNIAATDAESVKRYKAAGAHFLGKTNVPLGLADLQSYNEIYGQTNNPWNALRVPGGSSGGSAAALAAGLTGLESGSDIGGSIRIPSHFCGVYGHKPTWGIVPDQGHALPGVVASPDIAVVGPMARSAGDLAVALDVVAGADPFRQAGWKLALPRPAKRSLTEYRVAIWPSDDAVPVSTEISDRIQSLGDRLASLGAVVSDSARPAFDAAHSYDVYMCMLNGEMAAEFPDEVFEGIRTAVAGLEDSNQTIQAKALRASVQTHREWLKANHRRARLRQQWRRFFEDFDIVLCPVALRTAFPHDHSPFAGRTLEVDGSKRSYMDLLFWSGLVTVSYLPSTVFPTGPSSEGLPIGVQAVGAEFADHTCIDFARLMAGEIGGFAAPEGYDD